jgi:hypothetical protein
VAIGERAVVEVSGADTDPATDLIAGTVLAGGFRLELGTTPRPPAGVPGPAGTTADATTSVPRMEHTAVVTESVADAPPVAGSDGGPGPVTEAVAPPARPTPMPEPVEIDDNDPAAALAAIQAAAVGPDGQPLESPGPASPAAGPAGVPTEAVEPHDPDVTLPPPVSDELLADMRAGDSGDGRSSLVDAKLCANGHANPPTAATCAVCAEFLAPGAAAVVHVPRPSLGRLHLDDGELVDLDQELLVGRNPDRDDDPARSAMRRVKTLGEKVSRSHLEVRFQGWDVLVADCGSTNGTFVVPHPGGQVVALEPGRPQMIDAGAVVYFGSRSFTLLGREDARA